MLFSQLAHHGMDGGTFNNVSRKAPFQNFQNDKNVKSDSPSLRHTSDCGRKNSRSSIDLPGFRARSPTGGEMEVGGAIQGDSFTLVNGWKEGIINLQKENTRMGDKL